MRIAALVHNGVLNDARVIKEAMSLRAAGHEIAIHGISPNEQAQHHILPGSDINVFLAPRAAPRVVARPSKAKRRNVWALRLAIMWPLQLLALFAVGQLLHWCALRFHAGFSAVYSHEALLAGIVMMGVGGGIGFMLFRPMLWRAVSAALARRKRKDEARRAAMLAARETRPEPTAGDHFYRTTDALMNSLQRHPLPDAIHLHDHVALVLADQLKARFGLPLVWDAHEIYQELADSDPKRAQANAAIITAKHRFIDHFITINDSIAKYYQAQYPDMPQPVVVMNATVVEPVPVYDGRLHAAAQLPREQKIVLFQGGFAAHRGLRQMVTAAAELPPEWTLVMMGWGGLEEELRALAHSLPRDSAVPATVFLPGVPQHELQDWSAGATLGVIPYENTSLNHLYCTPNKLWEYPNAGVPVLCSDLIEMAAMIEQYRYGFLLPRDFTVPDIVKVVSGLTDDMLATARDNCKRFVAANNWSVWEKNLLAVYARIEDARHTAQAPQPSADPAQSFA